MENCVMKFSAGAFFSLAFSTISRIFATVDSPYSLSTLTSIVLFLQIVPLSTLSPSLTNEGFVSPVKAAVSKYALPSVTIPSSGTFSPGLTTITSPTLIFSGEVSFTAFPSLSQAWSGLISSSAVIEEREFFTAMSSNNSPIL